MDDVNRLGTHNIYSHKTHIGNWSEEQELNEIKLKDYLYRKETGKLLVHSVQRHLNTSLQEVPLTYSSDGFVHFGDHIMLYSAKTEGVLSVDLADKAARPEDSYATTTSTLTQGHVTRNTFVIEPVERTDKTGDVLKYAQLFRLRINPKLSDRPLYLQSQPTSLHSCAKTSRYQEVAMTSVLSFDCSWRCQFKNPNLRFEMEGQPVQANTELLIEHAFTKHFLASDLIKYYNDFGLEYEVMCHTYLVLSKMQNLQSELTGKLTVDTPARREQVQNAWAILTGSVPDRQDNTANASSAVVSSTAASSAVSVPSSS